MRQTASRRRFDFFSVYFLREHQISESVRQLRETIDKFIFSRHHVHRAEKDVLRHKSKSRLSCHSDHEIQLYI